MTERYTGNDAVPADGEALMGRLIAMAMHDMLNALAVIKENSGLMDDLLGLEASLPEARRARLRDVCRVVQEQVGLGSDLAEALKRFGAEAMCRTVEPAPLLRLLLTMVRRKARGKKISFVLEDAGARGLRASVPPSRLAGPILRTLDCCLEHLPGGAVVRLSISSEGGRGFIRFAPAKGEDGGDGWAASLPACTEKDITFEPETSASARVCFPCA